MLNSNFSDIWLSKQKKSTFIQLSNFKYNGLNRASITDFYLIYFDQHRYRQVCNNRNAVQESGFQSNFRNNMWQRFLTILCCLRHPFQSQIHVINVRIYHFKQIYGMNCIVCVIVCQSASHNWSSIETAGHSVLQTGCRHLLQFSVSIIDFWKTKTIKKIR